MVRGRFGRFLVCCLPAVFAAASVLALSACPPSQPRAVRVVIISLDGMSDWLLDRLLAADELPNIRRLLESGVAAGHAYTSFPAMTAAGHATIWTGTDPSRNGIHGNLVLVPPYDERTVVDTHTGFQAEPLRAEPIWAAAARQGKRVVVVQATQAAPFSYYLGEEARFPAPAANLILFDGYIEEGLPDEVITADVGLEPADAWLNIPPHAGEGQPLSFAGWVGDTELWFLLYDDPADPAEGFDSLGIFRAADGETALYTLKPGVSSPGTADRFSGPVEVEVGGKRAAAFFRLFSLAPDGGEMILYRSSVKILSCSDAEAGAALLDAVGGFSGNGASALYADGMFGPTLAAGGDGSAEWRYLETAQHSAELSAAALRTGMTTLPWELLIGYLAFPDEQNHLWLGFVSEPVSDPDSPAAQAVWPYLLETFSICDDFVGAALDALPRDAVLIVVSDHGFASADRYFFPNTVLRRAGLLHLTGEGEVDLGRTEAIYYPGNAGFVLVNSGRFRGGIVADEEAETIERRAREALLAARDEQGRPIVVGIFDPAEDEELGMGGPYAGDFYLQLAPGVYASGAVNSDEIIMPIMPMGVHHGDPRKRLMHSIFLIGGAPLGPGDDLGVVRSIDIAPTACALIGIEPPRDATGHAVRELVRRLAGGADR